MASFKSRKLKQFKKLKKQRNNKTRHTKYKYRRNTLKQTKRKSYRKTLSYYNVRKIFGGVPLISVSGEVMPPSSPRPRKSPRLPPPTSSFPAPLPPPFPEVNTPGPSLPPFPQVYTRAPSSPPSFLLLRPSPPLPSLPVGFSDAAPPPSPPSDGIMINLFSNQAIIAVPAVLWPLLCIILLFCCYRRRRNSDLDRDPRGTNMFRGGFNGTSILSKISRLSIDREHLQETISPFLYFLRVDDDSELITLLLNIDKDTNLETLIDTLVLKSGFTKLPITETQPLSPQSQELPSVVVDTNEAQRINSQLEHYASINIDDIDDKDINNIISVLSNILTFYLESTDKKEHKVKLLLAYMSFIQDYILVSDSKPVKKFSTHLTTINSTSGLDKIEIDYNSLKNIYDSL